jgi:Sir2 family
MGANLQQSSAKQGDFTHCLYSFVNVFSDLHQRTLREGFSFMAMRKERLVVLTGAGMSAESGIPTFRAIDGLWENHRI